MILQRGRNYKYIEIKKNRFDGQLGQVPITFDENTGRFRELSAEEVKKLRPTKAPSASTSRPAEQFPT